MKFKMKLLTTNNQKIEKQHQIVQVKKKIVLIIIKIAMLQSMKFQIIIIKIIFQVVKKK